SGPGARTCAQAFARAHDRARCRRSGAQARCRSEGRQGIVDGLGRSDARGQACGQGRAGAEGEARCEIGEKAQLRLGRSVRSIRGEDMTRSGIRAASVAALVLTVLSGSHPSYAQDDATKQARDHYQKGMVYFQSGDYPNAVAELKQAYQIKRIPGLLFNIGQTYRKMDDTDMSIFYFDKFLKEAPANAPQRADAEKILGELRAKKGAGQIAVPPPLEEGQQAQPGPQPTPHPTPQP